MPPPGTNIVLPPIGSTLLTPIVDPALRRRGRLAKMRGDAVEKMVATRLRWLGFALVSRIETGWRIRRVKGQIVGATPLAKVAADFTGINPTTGQMMVCEVKFRSGNLAYSDLDHHQVVNLDAYRAAGAVTLLAVVFRKGSTIGGPYVMHWPPPLFAPGASIDEDEARVLDLGVRVG